MLNHQWHEHVKVMLPNSHWSGECSYPAEFTDSCLSMYTALFGQLEEGAGGESVMHGKN